jgi:hypothetical protein
LLDLLSSHRRSPKCFHRWVINKKIDIIGASLRDFLLANGSLHPVWQALIEQLEAQKNSNVAEKDRLQVRLLLLDLRSSEGRFRHNVEKSTIGPLGLLADVPRGLEAIYGVQQRLFGDTPQEILQVRLYEHCPFAFMFATETEAFVQQYGYRNHEKISVIPLIKYLSNTRQYDELLHSFETIWEHASAIKWSENHVGTASSIEYTRIKNIFRKELGGSLTHRQIECL